MYALVQTTRFTRKLVRFERRHPELKERVARVLRDVQADPSAPHLHLHDLHGPLTGYSAVWVDHKHRILLALSNTDRRITLIDVGTHDEVYRV